MNRLSRVLIGTTVVAVLAAVEFPWLGWFAGFDPATALAASTTPAPTVEELTLEETIPLGDVKGRIDHMAIDAPRGRLFVAELGNDSVAVVDLRAHKLMQRLAGFKEPQGVAYAADTDRLFIASGGSGKVDIRKGDDLTLISQISLGADPDNIRLDGPDRIIVGYGGGALAVLDAATGGKIADIALAAHPEAFLPEPGGDRIFVNEPQARKIAVIDKRSGAEAASWGVPGASSNFPMALNTVGRLLYAVYRTPALISAFDTESGDIKAQLPTCSDADDVFHDADRKRVYVVCGDGTIAVLSADDGGLRELSRLQTRSGARTGLFVPELDRLFVAVPARSGGQAELRVYRPR